MKWYKKWMLWYKSENILMLIFFEKKEKRRSKNVVECGKI